MSEPLEQSDVPCSMEIEIDMRLAFEVTSEGNRVVGWKNNHLDIHVWTVEGGKWGIASTYGSNTSILFWSDSCRQCQVFMDCYKESSIIPASLAMDDIYMCSPRGMRRTSGNSNFKSATIHREWWKFRLCLVMVKKHELCFLRYYCQNTVRWEINCQPLAI